MLTKIWVLVAALAFLAAPGFSASVEEFYRGRTIRIVVGFGPGGANDTNARLLQKVFSKYIPGNPTIVVENKPGGGSMLAANTVYNTEPQDGTVIGAFTQDLVLQQALAAPGVRFDAAKYQWIGSAVETAGMCAARTDSGVTRIEDTIGERGKQLVVSSFGKGTPSHIPPAVFNATLGTKSSGREEQRGSGILHTSPVNNEPGGRYVRRPRSLLQGAHRHRLGSRRPPFPEGRAGSREVGGEAGQEQRRSGYIAGDERAKSDRQAVGGGTGSPGGSCSGAPPGL
ncbi:MAG: hypothetical protein HYV01_06145 [Deltaproteobacteria bacterium]|nr:hypothetical protein [Deltaproteobacteria bacterium]